MDSNNNNNNSTNKSKMFELQKPREFMEYKCLYLKIHQLIQFSCTCLVLKENDKILIKGIRDKDIVKLNKIINDIVKFNSIEGSEKIFENQEDIFVRKEKDFTIFDVNKKIVNNCDQKPVPCIVLLKIKGVSVSKDGKIKPIMVAEEMLLKKKAIKRCRIEPEVDSEAEEEEQEEEINK